MTAENRIRGMIELRECVRRLIDYQTEGYPDADVKEEQAKLNTLYDSFTKKYGLISSRGNKLAFSEDSSYCLLCSLEVLDEDGSLKRKTDMFTKRTIRPHVAVTSVDTASEALAVSIAEKARVDMEYMAQLSGKSPEELEAELSGVIFRNIEGPENPDRLRGASLSLQAFSPVTADEYLSGNVRRKLRMAKAFLEAAPDSQKAAARKQVEALEAVQPHDLGAGEIGVRIGANWVPIDVYQQFMVELLTPYGQAQNRIKILRSESTGQWNITEKNFDRANVKANTTYGTKRMSAYHILEQTLNQKDVRVFDYIEDEHGNKKPVLNKKETAIAQDRQELIKQMFGNIARLDNALENLAGSLQAEQSSLEETKGQLENARAELGAPFAREEELAEKTARLNELNVLLKVDEKDKTLIDSVPDEGEEVPERKVVGLER